MGTQPSPPGAVPPPIPPQGPTAKLPAGKGCGGCLGFIGLWILVFWIADYAGCKWTQSGTSPEAATAPAKDPSLRYVGPRGAVAGYDNHGRTTRLPPGTGLRATGDSYVDPMNGPTKIYTVTEGDLRGMQVPLSERDLEPQ